MSKAHLLPLLLAIALCSCKNFEPEFEKHEKLIGVQSTFVGEESDPASAPIIQKIENESIVVDYQEQYLTASFWFKANACGIYRKNISVSNDTIKLEITSKQDDLCESIELRKITYFIENEKDERWVILRSKTEME
jgi:hypothetical protein